MFKKNFIARWEAEAELPQPIDPPIHHIQEDGNEMPQANPLAMPRVLNLGDLRTISPTEVLKKKNNISDYYISNDKISCLWLILELGGEKLKVKAADLHKVDRESVESYISKLSVSDDLLGMCLPRPRRQCADTRQRDSGPERSIYNEEESSDAEQPTSTKRMRRKSSETGPLKKSKNN